MRSIPHIPGPHILMTLMLGGHHRMSSNNLTPSFPCPIMSSLSNTGHLISRLSWNQVRGDNKVGNKVTSHFEIESDFNLSGHWGSRPARYISVFWCLDDNGHVYQEIESLGPSGDPLYNSPSQRKLQLTPITSRWLKQAALLAIIKMNHSLISLR